MTKASQCKQPTPNMCQRVGLALLWSSNKCGERSQLLKTDRHTSWAEQVSTFTVVMYAAFATGCLGRNPRLKARVRFRETTFPVCSYLLRLYRELYVQRSPINVQEDDEASKRSRSRSWETSRRSNLPFKMQLIRCIVRGGRSCHFCLLAGTMWIGQRGASEQLPRKFYGHCEFDVRDTQRCECIGLSCLWEFLSNWGFRSQHARRGLHVSLLPSHG